MTEKERAEYTPPELKILGTVEELTLQNKDFGMADGGITFQGQPTTIP